MRCSAAPSSILSVRTESLPKSFIFLTIDRSTQYPIDVKASRNPDLQAVLRRGVRQDEVDHGWPLDEPIPNMRTVFRRSRSGSRWKWRLAPPNGMRCAGSRAVQWL